jgi:hypothetical protein
VEWENGKTNDGYKAETGDTDGQMFNTRNMENTVKMKMHPRHPNPKCKGEPHNILKQMNHKITITIKCHTECQKSSFSLTEDRKEMANPKCNEKHGEYNGHRNVTENKSQVKSRKRMTWTE